MTADIITFPVAERPLLREVIRDEILTAVYWYEQGLRSEDLPADMDTDMRERMKGILQVIEQG